MQNFLNNQIINRFLWVPFLLASGGALYFSISSEPPLWLCIVGFIAGLGCIWNRVPTILRAIMIFILGFCYAAIFTHINHTPQMPHNIYNANISGHILKTDMGDSGGRIYLRVNASDIIPNATGFATVRVSVKDTATIPTSGNDINANISLFRPSAAYAPATFDYARWAYFNNISAVGFASDINIINSNGGGTNTLREYLHKRANNFLTDGLVLGYKRALGNDARDVWTRAGIAHVWSISGFHMTLVAGWLMVIFVAIFRLIAPITRRMPARIPAMICAWLGLALYLLISGMGVATIRAFLMATLILGAMILGRSAFSLRNVCLAFCIIFCINPYYVMQAGFQLSFAAILGLVWFWNVLNPKMPENKIIKLITVAALTALIATMFTLPFVIAHFYSVPLYGLIGNLVLLPIFSFAIMPLVIVGTLTAIVGISPPLILANHIYDFAFYLANKIAALPHAHITMPHIPNAALCFIILGMMCIILIRNIKIKINYIFGAIFITLGIIITALNPRPIFWATADHELVAFENNGKLEFNKARDSNHFFAFNTWRAINGEAPSDTNTRRKHDHGIWRYNTPNFNLVYIQKFTVLQNNLVNLCNDDDVDYIVSYFKITAPKCSHKILQNGLMIYKSGTVKQLKFNRPWHSRH